MNTMKLEEFETYRYHYNAKTKNNNNIVIVTSFLNDNLNL